MKNTKQAGFSIFAVIAIIAILGIGIGTYNVKHKQAMIQQAQIQADMQQNADIDTSANINTNTGTTTTTDTTDIPPTKDNGGVISDGEAGVMGTMYIGPTCGIEIEGQPGMCGPKVYEGVIIFTSTNQTSKISVKATANSSGFFRVILPVGTYSISSGIKENLPTLSSPTQVTVKKNSYTNIRVDFDSGIR